jgi:hypothetical protein
MSFARLVLPRSAKCIWRSGLGEFCSEVARLSEPRYIPIRFKFSTYADENFARVVGVPQRRCKTLQFCTLAVRDEARKVEIIPRDEVHN